jgi:hypothetical protein
MPDAPDYTAYGRPESPEAEASLKALMDRLRAFPELQNARVNIGLSALLSTYLTLARDARVDTQAAGEMVKAGLAYLQRDLPNAPELSERSRAQLGLAQRIGLLLAGEEHAIALDALLFLYRTLAKKHECCLQDSIRMAAATTDELRKHQMAVGIVSNQLH